MFNLISVRKGNIQSVEISRDCKQIVSGSHDKSIAIWSILDKKLLARKTEVDRSIKSNTLQITYFISGAFHSKTTLIALDFRLMIS